MLKIQRSGFTETNLIFINSLRPIDKLMEELRHLDIQRMYSKAGFYDKTISGTYFDINYQQALTSPVFNKWLEEYKASLINCDYLEPMSHIRAYDKYKPYRKQLNDFIDSLSHNNIVYQPVYHNYWIKPEKIYPLLTNQKILIVNSFGSLIVSQYISGNVHKIFPNFPNLLDIDYIDFPYTFFNNGPHGNFFETLEHTLQLIANKTFDIVLVSCGPYGCIMCDRILQRFHKPAYTIGSGITPMFGIQPNKNEPYWISKIPKEYIPDGFEKIEKGRYWIGIDIKK